jgi:hypothetical protein
LLLERLQFHAGASFLADGPTSTQQTGLSMVPFPGPPEAAQHRAARYPYQMIARWRLQYGRCSLQRFAMV